MKININTQKKVEIYQLKVKAGVRYWEDASVNGVDDENGELIPCRVDDHWCPIIEVETGKITNWEIGKSAEIHYKVCDDGDYYLLNKKGQTVLSLEDDYVPQCLCPKESGFGDYIIMDIDENGVISDWDPTFVEFTGEEKDY